MIIFLEKVREKTIFSRLQPVIVEPLELEYLKSALLENGHQAYIIDAAFGINAPSEALPDMIILNGYNVAENLMIEKAKLHKIDFPEAMIAASGVHVQLNRETFRTDGFDLVVYSQSIEAFLELLSLLKDWDGAAPMVGSDVKSPVTDDWILGSEVTVQDLEKITPDREIYNSRRSMTRYLDRIEVALFKSGIGCPYGCTFCYCRELNGGKHVRSDYNRLFSEMERVGARNSWIVDDVLLRDNEDANRFIEASNNHRYSGEIIGYLRADFVYRYPELMPQLFKAGLKEAIIGFEAPFDSQLEEYKKGMSAETYKQVCDTLKTAGIDLIALFIVDPGYTHSDFKRLRMFISELQIEVYTISIFTPLKGTSDYEVYKEKIKDLRPEKSDFLHLILPSTLPKLLFYLEFYLSHLMLLKSGRVWKYILKRN